jgi:deoxycytidylate deaminase
MRINFELLDNLKTLCLNSNHPKVWVAAALVHRNKVISYGLNSMKSNPFQKRYGKNEYAIYQHAEIAAIQSALKLKFDRIQSSYLYVARIKWDGTDKENFVSGLALPCEGCMRCISEYGIRTVIYTMDHKEICKDNFGVITF